MRVLSAKDVGAAVTLREVIDAVETAQRLYGQGEAVNSSIATLFEHTDPAMLPELHGNFQSFAGYVGGDVNVEGLASSASCVQNPTRFGLPYAVGLQILNDVSNGMPLAVVERSFLTELVTPAMSAVGAKHLARKGPVTVGIIGCGKQGRTHLQAFRELLDVREALAFDVRESILGDYVHDMSAQTGVAVKPAGSVEEVVRASDVVEVAINPTRPIVKADWMPPGSLLIALSGFGNELEKDAVYAKSDLVVMDCPENFALSQGSRSVAGAVELSRIVAGREAGRRRETDRIVFVHSGMAINHVSAALRVYRKSVAMGLGTEFDIFRGA